MAASPRVSPPLASALLTDSPTATAPAPASPFCKKERRLNGLRDALLARFVSLSVIEVLLFADFFL